MPTLASNSLLRGCRKAFRPYSTDQDISRLYDEHVKANRGIDVFTESMNHLNTTDEQSFSSCISFWKKTTQLEENI